MPERFWFCQQSGFFKERKLEKNPLEGWEFAVDCEYYFHGLCQTVESVDISKNKGVLIAPAYEIKDPEGLLRIPVDFLQQIITIKMFFS